MTLGFRLRQSSSSLDPYISYLDLLAHLDGTNGGTSFPEMTGKTITALGSVTTQTGTKKFGTASAYFDGTGDALTVVQNASLDFAVDTPFTIEAQVKPDAITHADLRTIYANYDWLTATHKVQCILAIDTTGYLRFEAWQNLTTWQIITHSQILSTADFQHVAVSYDGTNFHLSVNGVVETTARTISSFMSYDYRHFIGACGLYNVTGPGAPGLGMEGYIDEVRVTNGVARYTANFTPPTSAFPNP